LEFTRNTPYLHSGLCPADIAP